MISRVFFCLDIIFNFTAHNYDKSIFCLQFSENTNWPIPFLIRAIFLLARALLDTVYDYTIRELLRPNLIVYLDAPVDVVS